MNSLRVLGSVCVAAGLLSACHRQPPMDEHMAHMAAGDLAAPANAASTAQGDMTLPPSNNTAAARLKASPRHAEWVKVAWAPGSSDSRRLDPTIRDDTTSAIVERNVPGAV